MVLGTVFFANTTGGFPKCLAVIHATAIPDAFKNLRLVDRDNGQGSVIAEIVLYGIMRYHYEALPVVPKIFYKQNANDNAKGADSVHIILDDKGNFTL